MRTNFVSVRVIPLVYLKAKKTETPQIGVIIGRHSCVNLARSWVKENAQSGVRIMPGSDVEIGEIVYVIENKAVKITDKINAAPPPNL